MITELKQNQVFVFGSNGQGFHGAGSAGYAMLHVPGNKWRVTPVPGTDLTLDKVPAGTKGYWAVKGMARGYQEGLYGKSYAIQTVTHPGAKLSIPLHNIKAQLAELWRFARTYPNLEFLMTPVGTGYSGYSLSEMYALLQEVIAQEGLPRNIILSQDLYSEERIDLS